MQIYLERLGRVKMQLLKQVHPMYIHDASPDIDEPTSGEYRDFEKNVPSSSSLLEQDTSLSQASQLTDDNASEKPQSVSKRKRGRPRKRGIE